MANDSELGPSALQRFGAALPALAALALVASVVYDYSFFLALGLGMNEIPSGLAEHVRSAVVWAPHVALTVAAWIFVDLWINRTQGGYSDTELIERSPNPELSRRTRRREQLAMTALSLIFVTYYAVSAADDRWIPFAIFILWSGLFLMVMNHPTMRRKFDHPIKLLLFASPIVLAIIGDFGFSSGAKLKGAEEAKWELVIKQADKLETISAFGVRRFATFAVAIDQQYKVLIVANEAIVQARTKAPLVATVKNHCKWFE